MNVTRTSAGGGEGEEGGEERPGLSPGKSFAIPSPSSLSSSSFLLLLLLLLLLLCLTTRTGAVTQAHVSYKSVTSQFQE